MQKLQEKRKANPIKLTSEKGKSIHVCPITNIRLIGDCSNYECPANLVRLTGGKKTGCYHAKSTVSIQDFALLWKVDAKTAQARYSNSISTLEKMTTLFTLLQQLREKCKWQYSCHNCGSPLENNFTSCLNSQKCSHRAKLIHKQKDRVPFCLPGLNIRKIDIWMFVAEYSKNELRQNIGVYFPETLWSILPPMLSKLTEKEE